MVTQELLKNSIQAKWRKNHRNIYIILSAITLTIGLFTIDPIFEKTDKSSYSLFMELSVIGILLVVFIPCIIFYQVQYKKTIEVLPDYKIYEVLLEYPSRSFSYKYSYYYSVDFTTEDGEYIGKDTLPMFGESWFSFGNNISEYNDQTISIAYSVEKDRMVVIG